MGIDYLAGAASGYAIQADAQSQALSTTRVVSTDPPYYDNIGYADLSDYFYVWLRRSLKPVFPEIFATLAVPKTEELVATPYRHGGREKAETFFLFGMTQAMHRLAAQAHPAFPVTIYYAFKQAESDGEEGTTNTGWDTFLAAVIEAGFAISGTWPMRTERKGRMIGNGNNALSSSIVLVCRQRDPSAPIATRRDFVVGLKAELPQALAHLQAGNIAPVDLAQAAIGPGMAVYTRYAKVVDADGKPLTVRTALALINQTLDEALAEQEDDFDSDTRWALTWFDQMGFAEGDFGTASTLAQAKNTGTDRLVDAGIIVSGKGKVRLLQPTELSADWDPTADSRLTVWETVQQLIRAHSTGGDTVAALLLKTLGSKAEPARELCYRLYTLCERRKRANARCSCTPRLLPISSGHSSTITMCRCARLVSLSARASINVRLSGVVTSAVGWRRVWRARSLLLVSPVRRPTLHGICSDSSGASRARAVSAARARIGVIHSTLSGSARGLRLPVAGGREMAKRLRAANHRA